LDLVFAGEASGTKYYEVVRVANATPSAPVDENTDSNEGEMADAEEGNTQPVSSFASDENEDDQF
jgi:hypothetical protein